MKTTAVISKVLLDGIRGKSYMNTDLYGSYVSSERLYQIMPPETMGSSLRYARKIGRWTTSPAQHLHADAGLVLVVEEESARLYTGGNLIESKVYDEADYHSRCRSLTISKTASGKTVLCTGDGSIGSKSASEFAKHGINVHTLDPDEIEISNPYRLGLQAPLHSLIGRKKCMIHEELIRASIPGAKIYGHVLDLCLDSSAVSQLIESTKPDLIYHSTDTIESHKAITWFSRQYQIPLINVALSDGAESGQIFFTDGKPESPCLMCLHPQGDTSVRNTRRQYAEEDSAAQLAVPSLSVDTSIIAALGTKVALTFLSGEDVRRYFTHRGTTGDVMWFSTCPDTWVLEDYGQKLVAKVEKVPRCTGCWTPSLEEIKEKHKRKKEMNHE